MTKKTTPATASTSKDTATPAAPASPAMIALELPRQIERMHRRYLDVVRIELSRLKADDISPVQFMMLQNISQGEISVRDLIERGYYLGSNASYNLKQLVEGGYVDRSAAARDKRTARLKLSSKGAKLFAAMRQRDQSILEPLLGDKSIVASFEETYKLLRMLERRWSETIRDDQNSLDDFDF